jgi:hypothetical protein
MAKLKTMTAEVVSKTGSTEPVEVVKSVSREKKPKLHNRVGYGSFKPMVIMKNGNDFVWVKRDDVLKKLEIGWTTVPRRMYRKAVADGATKAVAPVVSTKKSRKKAIQAISE